ncbi:hypothetical protein C8J57DRAFT_1304014, partial [Mycena rebaudengoi]
GRPSRLPIVNEETIHLIKELVCAPNYRMHAAQLEDREETEVASRHLMHPSFLRIMGCAPDLSPEPFVIYHGEVEGSADRMLAAVLREELSKCLIFGVTMVHGISLGLSYLSSKQYPVGYAEPKDFDLLIDANGNLKLCLKAGKVPPPDAEEDVPIDESRDALELLDGLCRMAFKDANRILYCDEVDRTVDTSSYPDSHPATGPGTSFGPQPSADYSTSIGTAGRRELVWKSSDKASNLREVSQQVENFLFGLRTAQSRRIVRRYLSKGMSTSHHRCVGYSREEIILSLQAQSTVISHSTPSPQEICTVCGQIVEDGGSFECSCRNPDDGQKPTKHCRACNLWHHVHCTCPCPSASDQEKYPCSLCGKTFKAQNYLTIRINCSKSHLRADSVTRGLRGIDTSQNSKDSATPKNSAGGISPRREYSKWPSGCREKNSKSPNTSAGGRLP